MEFARDLAEGGWPMTLSSIYAVVAVLVFWAVAAYAVWLWGPGLRRRTVWCPVYKTEAKVLVEQKEAGFRNSYAGLARVDILRCSLFNGDPLRCQKECLHLAPRQVPAD
jgi:hypothetical protein